VERKKSWKAGKEKTIEGSSGEKKGLGGGSWFRARFREKGVVLEVSGGNRGVREAMVGRSHRESRSRIIVENAPKK